MRVLLPLIVMSSACTVEHAFSERYATDAWYQGHDNLSDILWIVDDSCSMIEEQAALSAGFGSFVAEMAYTRTDFHLGMITTSFDDDDPLRGALIGDPPFLTPDDDYVAAFRARTEVGVAGSDKEKGLAAAVHALSPELLAGYNAGFLRPEAQLQIIVVSDEEDCSDEGALDGYPAEACYTSDHLLPGVAGFVDALVAIKGDPEKVQVGAIVGARGCPDAYPGRRYVEAAALTDGVVGDICEDDWSGILYDLGLNAAGIKASFRTAHAVIPETLEVHVNGELIEQNQFRGYAWDPETWYITFASTAIPDPDAEITAFYEIAPGSLSEP